uniref:Undecaprenyl-diphosphatase n=1 Tax=Eiseniibacteriota bacterium TaxID=2212470 RepID=A0A832MIL8_UNCEI
MSATESALLGALQGLTEFLPISSSAHLYVVPTLLGRPYAGVAYDVALHWGTLLALLFAYARDWWTLAADALGRDVARRERARGLWVRLAVASVPAAAAGLLLEDAADAWLRSLPLQAAMLVVFGFLLWAVDRFRPPGRDEDAPGWGTCLAMGCAQALALVPGVSRSGVTITAGRAAGLSRVAAARFSFLLATPITFGAGLVKLRDLPADVPLAPLAAGMLAAAIVGVLAIRGLIRWLGRAGFGAFFAYRVAFAAIIVWRLVQR